MTYDAKIELDSYGPNEARLTTFRLTYPRFVHAELMTHRVFSRNSASSRAIPTEKLLGLVEEDPVMPVWWGKNQSGMQAREELEGHTLERAKATWQSLSGLAVQGARVLGALGLHKQIANRVVEPWMFITVLVTATEWDNFFALRDHADAQPELARVAAKAHALYRSSMPSLVPAGDWHLPFVTFRDETRLRAEGFSDSDLCKISVGRCARVSYLTHDKTRDPAADIALADRLLQSGHMSPFEHVARALTEAEWQDEAEKMAREWARRRVPMGNFWGWLQYRKTLPFEHDFSLLRSARSQGSSE